MSRDKKIQDRARRKSRREAGKCTECGRDPVPNQRMCEKCRDSSRERQHRRRPVINLRARERIRTESPERRQVRRSMAAQNERNRRRKLKEQGICINCGAEPVKIGIETRCEVCHEKHLTKQRIKREEKRRIAIGLSPVPRGGYDDV